MKSKQGATPSVHIEAWANGDVNISEIRGGHPAPEPPLSDPPGAPRGRPVNFGYELPFVGRRQELTELWSFLNQREKFSWWLWTAPGGQGKSRLAAELCRQAQAPEKGWRCGFLSLVTRYEGWSNWAVDQPTLIVIDHVARRASVIRDAICSLTRTSGHLDAPVRFLLLERGFSSSDSWVADFAPGSDSPDYADFFECAYHDGVTGSGDELADATRVLTKPTNPELRQIFNAGLGETSVPEGDIDEALKLFQRLDPDSRPLFAILAAQAMAKGGLPALRRWNRRDLLNSVLRREFGLWLAALSVDKTNVLSAERRRMEEHLNLVVFATIAGRQHVSVLTRLSEYRVAIPERVLPDWIRRMTGESDQFAEEIPPLEPDVLGELFVLERIAGEFGLDSNAAVPRFQTLRLLDIALASSGYRTVDFIKRCVEDFGDHASIASFSKIKIPEETLNIGYLEDYCVRFSQVAIIMVNADRHDLSEEIYSQIIDHCLRYAHENEFRDLVRGRLSTAHYNRALERSKLARLEEAIKDCGAAIEYCEPFTPWQPSLLHLSKVEVWAKALLLRTELLKSDGQIKAAIADVTRALESRMHILAEDEADALMIRADLFETLGDGDQAERDYEQVVEIRAPNAEEQRKYARQRLTGLLWDRALVCDRTGERTEAVKIYNRLEALTKDRPEIHASVLVNRSAIFLAEQLFDQCIADCASVLGDPASPVDQVQKALTNRGFAHLSKGLLSNAESDVRELDALAIQLGGAEVSMLVLKARCRQAAGDRDGAIEALNTIRNMVGVDPEMRRRVERWLIQV